VPVISKSVDDIPRDKKQLLQVPPQKVAAGDTLILSVDLQIPDEYKLNTLAPLRAKLLASGKQALISDENLGSTIKGTADGNTAQFFVPLAATEGSASLELAVTYSYCRGGIGGLCKLHTARWSLPIEIAADGSKSVRLKTDMPK